VSRAIIPSTTTARLRMKQSSTFSRHRYFGLSLFSFLLLLEGGYFVPNALASTDAAGLGEEGKEPDCNSYDILEVLPHDTTSFTQGLTYANGQLYESTGLYGSSKVRRLDSADGSILQSVDCKRRYFAEGLAYSKDSLLQLTWKSGRGFEYAASDLSLKRKFSYQTTTGEGWGITYDPLNGRFIVSDGSANLHFWDEGSLDEQSRVAVTMDGNLLNNINELEYTTRGILANIWFQNYIVLIDPETGVVLKKFDFSGLDGGPSSNVLNGISVSDAEDVFYITGKLWSAIYKVRIPYFGNNCTNNM